ncbi:MAG: carbohydrate kinase family protein [bacterium]|nr:carbohydrate kinase family protein [bacterium]
MDALVGVSANLEHLHEGIILDGVEKLEPAKTTTVIAGSSANVALALSAHNWETHVIAAVGKNGPGNADIAEKLAAAGIGTTLLPVRDETPVATVLLYANGGRHLIPSKPPVRYPATIDAIDHVNGLGQRDKTLRIFTGVRPDEVPIITQLLVPGDEQRTILSPNRKLVDEGLLGAIPARIMFIGTEEMRGFWKKQFRREQRVPFTPSMMRMFFVEHPALELLVLTMGPKGSFAVKRDGMSVRQPAVESTLRTKDTTGCGDVFMATVLAYLYDKKGMLHCDAAYLIVAMRAAAIAASLKLQRIGGSSVPSRAEIERALGA